MRDLASLTGKTVYSNETVPCAYTLTIRNTSRCDIRDTEFNVEGETKGRSVVRRRLDDSLRVFDDCGMTLCKLRATHAASTVPNQHCGHTTSAHDVCAGKGHERLRLITYGTERIHLTILRLVPEVPTKDHRCHPRNA